MNKYLLRNLLMHKRTTICLFMLLFWNSSAYPENFNLRDSNLLNLASVDSASKNKPILKSNFSLSNNDKEVTLRIFNIGNDLTYKESLDGNTLLLYFESNYQNQPQSISKPSLGIKNASIKNQDDKLIVAIQFSDLVNLSTLKTSNIDNSLHFVYELLETSTSKNKQDIFKIKPIKTYFSSQKINRATAPPLGDMAVGTTVITNPNLLNIEGPNVSLVFKQTPAKKAIEFLLSKSNYSYAWVQSDPSFISKSDTLTTTNNVNQTSLSTSLSSPAQESSLEEEETTEDSPRLITLTIEDKPFSVAFNSLLIASGLQAKIDQDIVYVGPNVRETAFTQRISKIYRLNQTTANAAASYLANLGAQVTRTSTITTAVTEGSTQSETVSGTTSASTTTSGSKTTVQVYGSGIGPLVGLIATTDDRLQTITMIGSKELVSVAEGFLKKLDLRQRQVAITIKVLDVNLSDNNSLGNSWALRQNNNFIVNDKGKLLGAFGDVLPANSTDFEDSNTTKGYETNTVSSPATDGYSYERRERLNPGSIGDEKFVDFLTAEIVSANTKILASPTLILNEFPGKTGGQEVALSDLDSILKTGSIGRSYGNEAFVIVGTQVPTNCTSEGESSIPSFEYGLSGLTFGARIVRVDDNGFVTFTLSPAVSATAEKRDIEGCGQIDLLSVRRLDTGSIRVRDGHTLILTGVLNSEDKETVTKFPFFGDIPLIGQFFRSSVSGQTKRELVILVTPQILKDGQNSLIKTYSNYQPSTKDAKNLIYGEP